MNEPQFSRLLRQVQDGSSEAATELVVTYGPHIMEVVRRRLPNKLRTLHDSMDFVQAIWLNIVERPETLDRLKTSRQFTSYLAVMVRNNVIDEYRRQTRTLKNDMGRHTSGSIDQVEARDEMPLRHETPSAFAIANEQWDRMLVGVPVIHRRAIEMRRDMISNKQIAATLGISEKTVSRVIQDAADRISLKR